MKINQTPAFKGILVSKNPSTSRQQILIKEAISAIKNGNKAFYNILEDCGTDILLLTNNSSDCIDVKLLKGAGLSYSYTPEDKNGEVKRRIYVPDSKFKPDQIRRLKNKVKFDIDKFMYRAACCVTGNLNPKNKQKFMELENIAIDDMMSKNYISRPDLIPNATCVYGEQQVTTR